MEGTRQLLTTSTGQLTDESGVARPPWAYRSEVELDYYDLSLIHI